MTGQALLIGGGRICRKGRVMLTKADIQRATETMRARAVETVVVDGVECIPVPVHPAWTEEQIKAAKEWGAKLHPPLFMPEGEGVIAAAAVVTKGRGR